MHYVVCVPHTHTPVPPTRNQSTDLMMVRILGRWIHFWRVALCRSGGDVPHSKEVRMCRICGSDDVVVNGEDVAMVCEACKEEAWTAADAAQADSWRVAEEVGV